MEKKELKVREDNEVVNAKTKGREVIESNHVYQEHLWGACLKMCSIHSKHSR